MRFYQTLRQRLRANLPFLMLIALFVSACGASPAVTTSTAESSIPEPTLAATEESLNGEAATAMLFPLTITDAAGVEYTFDAPPKIGCWWAGCSEMFADLGIPPHAASYTDETATSVALFPAGTPAHNIADSQNPELWAAAEVDLILMRVPVDPAQEPIKAAAPIFYLHHPSYGESSQHGYAAFVENLRLVGQLTGKPAEAEAAIARFDTVMASLRALSTPETQALSVAVLFQGDGYRVIGPGNPFCVALAEAQLGQCVGEGEASYEVNAEEFLGLDPNWLIYQSGDGSYQDRTDPVWSQLTAVQEGRVFDAQGNRYYCCSLRGLTHALQEYVHYVLPEAAMPAPGPWLDFDPLQSPLVQKSASAESEPAVTATTGETREVVHDFGTTVVPANPQRIVAINSAAIELVAALGIKPVGIAAWTGAGNEARIPAHIAAVFDLDGVEFLGDANQPNLEAIAAVAPDLIVMNGGSYYQDLYDQVSQIAPTVAYAAWPDDSNRSTWKEFFINTATALGKEAEAQTVIDAWEARVAEFTETANVNAIELSVVRLMPETIMAYKKGSYSGTVLEDVGVKQVAAQEEVVFAQDYSMEQIPDLDGDAIMLIQSDPNGTIYNQLVTSPLRHLARESAGVGNRPNPRLKCRHPLWRS